MTIPDDTTIDEELRAATGEGESEFELAPTEPGIEVTGDTVPCPWCGEPVDLFLEPSGEASKEEFVEECPACSHDFLVIVEYDMAGTPHVAVRRDE